MRTALKTIVPLVAALSLGACSLGTSYPDEIGVFVETDVGWERVPSRQYEGMMGNYLDRQNFAVEALPVVENGAKIYFNGIPLDASQVYWVRDVRVDRDWKGDLDPYPISLRPTGDGAFEATIEGMQPGVKNFFVKRGYAGLGHFVMVQ